MATASVNGGTSPATENRPAAPFTIRHLNGRKWPKAAIRECPETTIADVQAKRKTVVPYYSTVW